MVPENAARSQQQQQKYLTESEILYRIIMDYTVLGAPVGEGLLDDFQSKMASLSRDLYSRLSLSRLWLSGITAYLEEKI